MTSSKPRAKSQKPKGRNGLARAMVPSFLLTLGFGLWAFGLIPAAAQGPTFRGGTDLVAVGVSVRDRGRPIAGLKAGDFEILDNGVAQDVLDVGYENLPIDVTVALDISESVTGAVLDQMRRAVGQLDDDLTDADRLKLLTFNMRVRRVLNFTEPRDAAPAALEHVKSGGGTSLVDTLAVALVAPSQNDRRQLVIVFSDGIDTSSVTDRATILDLARHGAATATFVLPGGGTTLALARRDLYDQIAAETGGMVVPMEPHDDLGPTFRHVLSEFRSSYVLHFVPKGVTPGGVHTLEVRVSRKGADVRARQGYAWH